MSTRQNKKRKGRSNVLNRERTVTTLTEGPESSFLIPTPTEEPGTNLMSSPFSVASSSAGSAMPPAAAFQIDPSNFGPFPYNGPFMQPMPPPNFGPQQFYPPAQGPPGQNDLEVLQRLKDSILRNQHEFFRAVPRPAALANLYQGPRSSHAHDSAPLHPEQVPANHQQASISQTVPDLASTHGTPGTTPDLANLSLQTPESLESSRKPVSQTPKGETRTDLNVLSASITRCLLQLTVGYLFDRLECFHPLQLRCPFLTLVPNMM